MTLKITPQELPLVTKYILSISGISLDASKKYLLETRLHSVAAEFGCSSYQELYTKAKADTKKVIERKIIDAISTNETFFFRDTGPFELLQHKIFPELIDKRKTNKSTSLRTPLRVWSAASSTGQELYSVAMILQEILRQDINKYNIQLLGTDISDAALAKASSGVYNKFEIERGLAKDKLSKYFTLRGAEWKVKDQIRAMASFRKFNLMTPFTGLGKFDIILCRNVAIYFTLADRKKLFDKIANILEPDGYLIIGSTESLTGVSSRFVAKRHLRSLYYQLQ